MKTILVVDDEFDISEVICAILRADGYQVDVCTNGKDAVEYLKDESHRPCLVILDIMMPFLSGYDVLRFMKSKEGIDGIPVILMSAVQPSVKQQDLGWDDFLRKPFNIDALERLVSKHTGGATDQAAQAS
jgi:DNA-binding response OmpR family regulator